MVHYSLSHKILTITKATMKQNNLADIFNIQAVWACLSETELIDTDFRAFVVVMIRNEKENC